MFLQLIVPPPKLIELYRSCWRHSASMVMLFWGGGWGTALVWHCSPFSCVHSCLAGAAEDLQTAAVLTRESQALSVKFPGKISTEVKTAKTTKAAAAVVLMSNPFRSLRSHVSVSFGHFPACVASIFKTSTPYLIIYTLEANWRCCFLWRKWKGVCGGIKAMHGLVSLL